MLYDNGQLAQTYLDAFRVTGDARYARVARGVLDYLRRDMTHPEGGIFSAEVRAVACGLLVVFLLAMCVYQGHTRLCMSLTSFGLGNHLMVAMQPRPSSS
jgi:hypothetical protein